MDDISRELGISKKTLYQYVENKADLIRQIIEAHIAQDTLRMAEIRKQSTDAIEEMVLIARHVIQFLRRLTPTTVYDLQKYYRDCWEITHRYSRDEIYRMIKGNLEKGIEQGIYRMEMHPDVIARMYIHLAHLVVNEDVFPRQNYQKEKLFKQLVIYHIQGIASRKGLEMMEKHLPKIQESAYRNQV